MTGMAWAVATCGLLGALTVGTTIRLNQPASQPKNAVPLLATEDYGRRLLAQTPELLGPDAPDPKLRYMNSRLSCGSCHLGTGTEPGTLSLPDALRHYPRFSPRVGGMTTIEDRVNECMSRSMNGRPLPKNSPEMIAITSYIRSLSDRDAASGPAKPAAKEPPPFKTPDRAADLNAGERLLKKRCAACHGADGAGLLASANPVHGYVFPPLWGSDSFNTGAGMHRVLTAAKFIKAKMPLGKPDLTDDEAFDVAAFVNSKPRPEMAHLELDYPDRGKKPVDTGYGPFADSFPLNQHQFGPFRPIEAAQRQSVAK